MRMDSNTIFPYSTRSRSRDVDVGFHAQSQGCKADVATSVAVLDFIPSPSFAFTRSGNDDNSALRGPSTLWPRSETRLGSSMNSDRARR